MIKRLKRRFISLLHSLIYRTGIGRETRLFKKLTQSVRSCETSEERGDVPMDEEAWEDQYLSGKWGYLENMDQLARYSIIISYMAFLRPGGAVLDVGCGEGILFERFRPYGFSQYEGIDISGAALTRLIEKQEEKTLFMKADAETYTPSATYDIIVFNEVVYYFHDPMKTVERYTGYLKKDGVLIVSTFTGSERALSILKEFKATYSLLDESRITHETSSKSWICSVFMPLPQA